MDDNEDFFFNAALSCYKTTTLFGYSIHSASTYKQQLKKSLGASSSANFDEIQTVQWKCESRVFNNNSVEFSFIYIQCKQQLYRICLLSWANGGLMFANCAPTVLTFCINWISTRFDSIIKPLIFPTGLLKSEFNRYISQASAQQLGGIDSELIFATGASDLAKITIRVPFKDAQSFLHQNDDIFTRLFEHLQNTTAVDFSQLDLTRVNCGGFIMTHNGKLKIFKKASTAPQMWDTVARILASAQT